MRLPVGLLANGFLPGSDQILRLLPGRSPDQLVHVLELLAVITPYTMWTIEEVLLSEVPRLPRSATLAVVSATMQEGLWRALAELAGSGRQVLLFALAEEPPKQNIPGLAVYHLPHLVGDLISPRPIMEGEA
jgi:hypothetical protein